MVFKGVLNLDLSRMAHNSHGSRYFYQTAVELLDIRILIACITVLEVLGSAGHIRCWSPYIERIANLMVLRSLTMLITASEYTTHSNLWAW